MFLHGIREKLAQAETQGNVAMAAGALLVIDGLVGIDNPLRGRNGKRTGIAGCLLMVVIGAVFAFMAVTVVLPASKPHEGGIVTTGRVVDNTRSASRDSDGNSRTTYAPIVEYRDSSGASHRATALVSGSSPTTVGTELQVSYLPHQPAAGRVIQPQARWMGQVFLGVGLLVMGAGMVTFVFRLASIVGGLYLISWGSQRRRAAPGAPMFPTGTWGALVAAWARSRYESRYGEMLPAGFSAPTAFPAPPAAYQPQGYAAPPQAAAPSQPAYAVPPQTGHSQPAYPPPGHVVPADPHLTDARSGEQPPPAPRATARRRSAFNYDNTVLPPRQ